MGKGIEGFLSPFSIINVYGVYDSDLYHRQDIVSIDILIIYYYWADGFVELTTCTVAHAV